ncbi:4-hydroxy-tetrahydrodipicolinate synthase [Thermoanaerobacter wiegelii]|uniref:4-hydroxy-tetrahydrodipicolinate synthase n=1 Tax=Thermoanaerobacter wiegelii Rt8.B1 TaxID=697303 RepID=G2MUV8_9THEO|nr:4-hydroxy-tetrahydrodipicolinate synthase [Thermoanaerobacter wiegelii]AEM77859.1 Dihydrodipicolinate synthase [Thermoanaerobacter wiegelii Rt8.B1]
MFELKGVIPALVTPMTKDYKLDLKGLCELIDFQIKSGSDSIIVGGSTGEYNLLTEDERREIIRVAVEYAAGRIPVIAGTGSNSTDATIRLSKYAEEVGADAVLVINPYYPNPGQNGLYEHFKELAKSVNIPIIIYNWPAGTNIDISIETLEKLSEFDNIIGIKDTAPLEHTMLLIAHFGKRYAITTGLEIFFLSAIQLGATGGIGVAQNIIPRQMVELYKMAMIEPEAAKELHYRLLPLYEVLFIEPNPVPIKTALNIMGMPAGPCRPPLQPMRQENIEKLKTVLKELGLC